MRQRKRLQSNSEGKLKNQQERTVRGFGCRRAVGASFLLRGLSKCAILT